MIYKRIFIDKRLPKEIIKNKGFTKDGSQYDGIFYHYWRDTKHSEMDLIITTVPSIFIDKPFIDIKCIKVKD